MSTAVTLAAILIGVSTANAERYYSKIQVMEFPEAGETAAGSPNPLSHLVLEQHTIDGESVIEFGKYPDYRKLVLGDTEIVIDPSGTPLPDFESINSASGMIGSISDPGEHLEIPTYNPKKDHYLEMIPESDPPRYQLKTLQAEPKNTLEFQWDYGQTKQDLNFTMRITKHTIADRDPVKGTTLPVGKPVYNRSISSHKGQLEFGVGKAFLWKNAHDKPMLALLRIGGPEHIFYESENHYTVDSRVVRVNGTLSRSNRFAKLDTPLQFEVVSGDTVPFLANSRFQEVSKRTPSDTKLDNDPTDFGFKKIKDVNIIDYYASQYAIVKIGDDTVRRRDISTIVRRDSFGEVFPSDSPIEAERRPDDHQFALDSTNAILDQLNGSHEWFGDKSVTDGSPERWVVTASFDAETRPKLDRKDGFIQATTILPAERDGFVIIDFFHKHLMGDNGEESREFRVRYETQVSNNTKRDVRRNVSEQVGFYYSVSPTEHYFVFNRHYGPKASQRGMK